MSVLDLPDAAITGRSCHHVQFLWGVGILLPRGLCMLGTHSSELYSAFLPLKVVLEINCIIQWQKDSTEY